MPVFFCPAVYDCDHFDSGVPDVEKIDDLSSAAHLSYGDFPFDPVVGFPI